MFMSEQEPARLQGTQVLAAQAVLAEQLPLPPPNPALLTVQIWGGAILRNLKYPPREEASGVPAPWPPDASVCPQSQAEPLTLPLTGVRIQDPGTAVLTGEGGVAFLTLGPIGTVNGTESE